MKSMEMGPIHQILSKVNTRRTNDDAVCLAVLFFHVIPRHTNMIDKGFNLFDECGACQTYTSVPSGTRVHLFFLGDSKMYTSGSIASSQRMLTEINESNAIAKIRI